VRDPKLPGPITMRVKDGASQYWLALLADNHGNPLSKVEVRSGGGFTALQRTDYNYWIDENGSGGGPFTVRLTDIYGHQATVAGITLSPLKIQKTTMLMYPSSTAGSAKKSPATPAPSAPSAPSKPASVPPSSPASEAGAAVASGAPSPWASPQLVPACS
jgi:hypothetical protein